MLPSATDPVGRRVFLHVGLPKTGTTYLQDRLWRNRSAALRQGVLYPGDRSTDHFHAAVHLQPERYLDWVDPAFDGAWDRLVGAVRAWPGTSVISHELFASATAPQAAAALADLSFAQVHIVVTARDLGRQIPSAWQEDVKNQQTATFDEFLATTAESEGGPNTFWEFQDLPRVLDTWAGGLPADRVHVVTVPPAGGPRDELWRRFTATVGLDADALPATVPGSNAALSTAQIELLRRMNTRLQPERIEWARYEAAVKEFLIGSVLFDLPAPDRPALPPAHSPWVRERAHAAAAVIRERGYDVVGDLSELEPVPPRRPAAAPSDEELLELALDTLAETVRRMPLPQPTLADRARPTLRRVYKRMGPLRTIVDRFR
ncbi:sulfotransferase family protein [Tsukamurella soli]|uniref:Sulfotransferase family protein n=1 Tax=Tsukamurella soli TaxID=644556 RepID=A0ABP8J1P5_9ACTN